ncbi:Uncharacterized protein TCM_001856 [Theobroma cacao]|uniref:Integrase catalytic domain-containing protein n=1 Tax=Theobroma cacao TaxID=3641 RepID=A0A061DSM9_THECC|nr:Uncharacterized protein TCM_001856 [Theobroma cacao]
MGCETANKAWSKLEKEFLRSARSKHVCLQNLRRKYELLRMKENQTVGEFVEDLMKLVNQIRLMGDSLIDLKVVENIMLSLPERFNSIITSLEQVKDITKLLISDLVLWKLMNRGRQQEEMKGLGVKCNACKQLGHVEKVCKNKAEVADKKQQIAKQVEKVEVAEEVLFMTIEDSNSADYNHWLLDSACSNHMTSKAELFLELDTDHCSSVKIGNGFILNAVGKGTVAIQTASGTSYVLNVLLVPEITQNLLSVGQLIDEDYMLVFKNNACTIYESSGVYMMFVPMVRNCFSVKWGNLCLSAIESSSEQIYLWHKRLGHCNYKSLLQVSASGLLLNLPKLHGDGPICSFCQYGKLTRRSFPKASLNRAEHRLEFVHSDVAGPINNGGEYISSEFTISLEKEGIHHQLTTPYCLEQNGVSERKNRTIIEMSKCLLFEKKLPKSFGAEVANTAVYLQNILITQAVNNETPYEAWYSSKPSVDHLRIFESICYFHVPEELRDKLQPKAKLGVFIGYSQQSKAYRIYQIESGKVSVSRHVTFDEDRPKHHHVLGVKWVFRMKLNSDGSLNEHNARLVVKGFAQLPGVDYHETFAPVAKMDTIRLLLALKKFSLSSLSFESEPNRDKVYKLHKALYGLKQAPRAWYCKFDDYLKGNTGIFICQSNYIGETLDKFKMTDCKTVATPLIPHEKLSIDKGSALENPSAFRSLIGSHQDLT